MWERLWGILVSTCEVVINSPRLTTSYIKYNGGSSHCWFHLLIPKSSGTKQALHIDRWFIVVALMDGLHVLHLQERGFVWPAGRVLNFLICRFGTARTIPAGTRTHTAGRPRDAITRCHDDVRARGSLRLWRRLGLPCVAWSSPVYVASVYTPSYTHRDVSVKFWPGSLVYNLTLWERTVARRVDFCSRLAKKRSTRVNECMSRFSSR
jgi:hypothetical protein